MEEVVFIINCSIGILYGLISLAWVVKEIIKMWPELNSEDDLSTFPERERPLKKNKTKRVKF